MSASIALECPRSAAKVPSNSNSPLRPEIPLDPAARRHHTAHLPAELLLQRRPPGHELKAEPVVDHGEPAGSERDALAIDAGDVFAFGRRAMGEAGFGARLAAASSKLPPAQGVEKIARENDALALPPRQTFLDEMIDPTVHRLADLGAEAAAAERRVSWREAGDRSRSRRAPIPAPRSRGRIAWRATGAVRPLASS